MSDVLSILIPVQGTAAPERLDQLMENASEKTPQLDFSQLAIAGSDSTWPLGNTLWGAQHCAAAAQRLVNNNVAFLRSVLFVNDAAGKFLCFVPQNDGVRLQTCTLLPQHLKTKHFNIHLENGGDLDAFFYSKYSRFSHTLAIETGFYDHHFAHDLCAFFEEELETLMVHEQDPVDINLNLQEVITALQHCAKTGIKSYSHFGIEHRIHHSGE